MDELTSEQRVERDRRAAAATEANERQAALVRRFAPGLLIESNMLGWGVTVEATGVLMVVTRTTSETGRPLYSIVKAGTSLREGKFADNLAGAVRVILGQSEGIAPVWKAHGPLDTAEMLRSRR